MILRYPFPFFQKTEMISWKKNSISAHLATFLSGKFFGHLFLFKLFLATIVQIIEMSVW